MVAAGGEKPVDDGLGIHVCELGQLLRAVEIGDENLGEGLPQIS